MKDVKTLTSRSYHQYLISSLKDTQEAAAYIETFLELEEGFEPFASQSVNRSRFAQLESPQQDVHSD